MNKYLLIIIIALIGVIGIGYYQVKETNERWKIAEANVKAYSNELSSSKTTNTALLLSVSQLEYFNDSILKELNSTREDLKIKDKNLKALLAIYSNFSKEDTIRITLIDTLFKEPNLSLDTLIGDDWYNLQLKLRYPSTINIKPFFRSQKYIIVSSKKETVAPPKKFFLLRWFLKKHKVLHIDVIEKNPYVNGENSKYVEILK